ncbi:SDR family oxidoreductase [Variovorax sp. PBL-E5]|uniref:SDR family oxidoreductase n=1 Tax=Variovorax sp. PBL-E5 TaxID=434014 RepID=UPI0013178719|nr:SDR family oxidoreductase [Variovorax sp. PBL-E5]VTU39768.1 Glucose 1-dehydrogenase 2 [Variovorax sp. PBL-E5]
MASPTIIITGSSRGIGAATARLAARRGWSVGVNYASNQEAADAVVAQIRAEGGRAIAVQGDNSRHGDVERLFDQVAEEFGPVGALVNNAGVPGQISRVEQLSEATLRRTLEVNVVGAFLCAQAFLRRASTRHGGTGGAIVNVSSMAARTGSPGELVHYAAAKAALEAFNYGLAAEVAQEGVRVNAVSLGLFATEIHAAAGDADRLQRYAARMPMGRAGEPMEAAQAIVWLLSDEASYITGATLPVAGGR